MHTLWISISRLEVGRKATVRELRQTLKATYVARS